MNDRLQKTRKWLSAKCPELKETHIIICYETRNIRQSTLIGNFICNGWWGRLLLPESLGQPVPVGAISTILVDIRSYSDSAVASGKRSSIITLIGSRLSNEPKMNNVRCPYPHPPKGDSKMQNGLFPCKIALCLNKVCYKVSSCENCQRRHSLAYIYPCENDWWGRPLLRENLVDTDTSPCKTPIFNLFSLVAPQP